jgi:hypothetical protein
MSFTKILGSGISTQTNLHVGVLSATKFIGDGSELLNVTNGVGVQSGGSSVGSGITSLNFIGVGNTFALRGDVLDISISSGSNGIVGINTAGISTFNDLNVSGNVSIAGTLTYEDVKNVDSVGLITARSGINVIAGGINVSGVVTANDGLSGIGIHSAGTVIHSGIITALNFIGAGNTFAVNGTTVDISIAGSSGGGGGGGAASAGSAINYPSGNTSPFVLNSTHITENITLDNTNADTVDANVITGESTITVDEGVTITIEEGKTVIPDLYNVLSDTYTAST